MMLEELQRRNYSNNTTRYYLQAVSAFAKHFGKAPDKLGPDELRSYQAYLLKERKLAVGTVIARVAALRFFFVLLLRAHAEAARVQRRPAVSEEAAPIANGAEPG
jgi:integrase/recombinase XerD